MENTRDNPIGPHTLGGHLLPGDVVLLGPGRAGYKARIEPGDDDYQATVIEAPFEGRRVRIFPDDKYVLVKKR